MSRVGNLPIELPKGVETHVEPGFVRVKGPKGRLERIVPAAISIEKREGRLVCSRPSDSKEHRCLHGLTRTLVANMVTGVTSGFQKQLILDGVGYRASADGRKLNLALGLSHSVEVLIPEGIQVEATSLGGNRHQITIRGIDKELVGQFAADIRRLRPVEPYNEKGFRYTDEVVRRKAGKSAVGGGAPGAR